MLLRARDALMLYAFFLFRYFFFHYFSLLLSFSLFRFMPGDRTRHAAADAASIFHFDTTPRFFFRRFALPMLHSASSLRRPLLRLMPLTLMPLMISPRHCLRR